MSIKEEAEAKAREIVQKSIYRQFDDRQACWKSDAHVERRAFDAIVIALIAAHDTAVEKAAAHVQHLQTSIWDDKDRFYDEAFGIASREIRTLSSSQDDSHGN